MLTDAHTSAMRRASEAIGDLSTAMICARALGDELEDAEDGTDGAYARSLSVEEARAIVAGWGQTMCDVLRDTEAENEEVSR
jgi:hypothetical protein